MKQVYIEFAMRVMHWWEKAGVFCGFTLLSSVWPPQECCVARYLFLDSFSIVAKNAVNGGWTSWGQWGSCNAHCSGSNSWGYGTKTRTRTCTQPKPENGGRQCDGSSSKEGSCWKACPRIGNFLLLGCNCSFYLVWVPLGWHNLHNHLLNSSSVCTDYQLPWRCT